MFSIRFYTNFKYNGKEGTIEILLRHVELLRCICMLV